MERWNTSFVVVSKSDTLNAGQKRASRELADPKRKKLKLKLMGSRPGCRPRSIDCHSGRRYASELRVLHVLGAPAVQSKGGQSKYLQTDNLPRIRCAREGAS